MAIDPTARVAEGARIGEDVEIGPYCLVGPQVELASGVRLLAHVNVTGATTIGEGTVVYPFSSLGTPPQSVHYRGGPTRLVIGARCELREGVTMNTGTEDGGGVTRVGDRCLFMVGSHVGHDCQVGNDVTLPTMSCSAAMSGRRSHVSRRPCRDPSIRAHRRGRDDGRHVGGARRHHSVRLCARPDRRAGRLEYRRSAPARRHPRRDASGCAAPIARCFSWKAASRTGSRRSRANSPAIRWSAR